MKAVIIESPNRAIVSDVPYPEPGPNEVTIHVMRCGICGTDLHIFKGDYLSPYPLIPGHEFSGIVDRIGDGVKKFKLGDRVAVDPSLFCGECELCLSGRGNHCESWGAIGDTTSGAMAEYVKVPASNVFRLPDHMSFAEGAFIEPVACVVHGLNQLQMKVGQSVLVFGAGSMGQLLIQALARSGSADLTVVDVDESKLTLARSFGATHTYLSKDSASALADRMGSGGFEVVVDATGIPSVIQSAFDYLGPKGMYLQFGVAPVEERVSVSPFNIYHMDWKIVGSMAVNHTYRPALDWMGAGRFDVQALISKSIRIEDVPGFLSGGKASNLMKVQISFEQD